MKTIKQIVVVQLGDSDIIIFDCELIMNYVLYFTVFKFQGFIHKSSLSRSIL